MRARVFKFLIHLESGQIYCGTENQDAEIYFYLLFPFFLFSISHSNVIHREICVKDFSGTTVPRILTLGTNVGYDLLYRVKENQHAAAYHSPYLSIFNSPEPKAHKVSLLDRTRAGVRVSVNNFKHEYLLRPGGRLQPNFIWNIIGMH